MKLDNIISEQALTVIKNAGLNKVVGAMEGCEDLGLKEAAQIIGEAAYKHRKETAKIAKGIEALDSVLKDQ